MHFLRVDRTAQLTAGSSDANYALDFGPNVAPPTAPTCSSYFDLLGVIQGLTTFANAEWYAPMVRALYRVREFVVANMGADPGHSPSRVQRTLHEVNQFLGAAFVHLSSDSPSWWRDFCAAVHRISFNSVSWAMALNEITTIPAAVAPGPASSARSQSVPLQPPRPGSRGHVGHAAAARPIGIPAHIRALIPRNNDGQEPCLRFFAGSMCFGGTKALYTSNNRTHEWPDDLPAAFREFITKKFGRRGHNERRRD